MEGTLDEIPLAEVLHDFHARRRSGVLHLSRAGTTKRIYFKEGAIVFASSDDASERLGERLVRAGALRRSDLELACKVMDSSRLRLGATLVDMGYLSRDDLDRQVKQQVTEILASLFPWSSGAFRAELTEQPVEIDLERRDLSTTNLLMESARRIEDPEAIRRGLGDLGEPLSYGLDPRSIGDLRLTPEEGFVLSRVDGVTSAGEIASLSPMGESETLRCIYALVAAGLLRLPAAPLRPKTAARTVPPQAPAESEVSETSFQLAQEWKEMHSRASDANLYAILDVEPTASAEAIRAAYFRMAKKLHPDHRAGMKLQDPDGIFDDLYMKVKHAYEVLSSETERRRYDFQRQQQAQRKARAQASAASDPPRGESNQDPVTKKTFTPNQTARIHFANGERFLQVRRYHEAVEELRSAVRLDPGRSEYQRLLGKALSKNPKWRKQAEEHLWKALDLDRFDAESYLALGELYEAGGLETRARKMFEDALAVDPENVLALTKLARRRAGASALGKLMGILHRPRAPRGD